ncbi:MAG: DUF1080 domain-containing protein [Bacteroidetes bacterium]|nr:DUF1080 domain-containing protein [Bacteroidota bacterium]
MKLKKLGILALIIFTSINILSAQNKKWQPLFTDNLSNADYPAGVWTVENGVITASEDQAIWTQKEFDNFILDLEFKTADGTNSGVIVYCSDTKNWIPNAVEIQIADDHAEKWATSDKTWQCAAIFGHLAASESRVKKPGEWNKMNVTCNEKIITVELNGKKVTEMDMALWISGKKNPNGTDIPSWLNTPFTELATIGKIGFQGKHAGAPIWFRSIKVKELK